MDDRSSIPPDSSGPPTSRRSVDQVGTQSSRTGRRGVASQILDVLREYGVDTVFGIPGGAVSAMYGALHERGDFRVVNAKHETGAVFMAMGHALATGKPAAVITTAGPGVTNALTGLASAFYESLPVVMISGEVSTTAFGRGALQEGSPFEMDVLSQVRRITKFAAQLSRPDTAVTTARKALNTALSGRRGPVFLSLPLNVSSMGVIEAAPISGAVSTTFQVSDEACLRAVNLLLEAERPLILAGAGARGAKNRAALVRLAELTGTPVAVSPKAKGVFPEDHPLYKGIFGFGGHESVVTYLNRGVDVALICASGLNDFATNSWSPVLSASRAFMQIDLDTAQLGKNYPIDLGILGPLDMILGRMVSLAAGRSPQHVVETGGVETHPVRPSPRGLFTTAEAMLVLNEMAPSDAVFTADMGEHLSVALHYLRVRKRADFVTCLGFGSMGSGICTAIGYQIGTRTRRVYAVTGDGCFLMYGNELATAVQHRAPVTVLIANDSRLNMCEHGLRDLFGKASDCSTQLIDFASIARSMGAIGDVVYTREELIAALSRPIDGPQVLDVRIDPAVRLEGSQRTAALRQFQAR